MPAGKTPTKTVDSLKVKLSQPTTGKGNPAQAMNAKEIPPAQIPAMSSDSVQTVQIAQKEAPMVVSETPAPTGSETTAPNLEPETSLENEPEKPATPDTWVNPADVAMQFDKEVHNFGTLTDGETTTFKYTLTNTGKAPLEIETVSACFCLSVQESTDFIRPGEKAVFECTFDSNDQVGAVKKDIDIIFKNEDKDGYPLIKRVTLKGRVLAKKK